MKKSSGRYVMDGTKKSFFYYIHHLSKFFVFWVVEFVSVLGKFCIFLDPIMQKFNIQMCKMIDDSGETNMAKAFDQTDHKKGYRSLVLFDFIWLLFTLAGIGAFIGIGVLLNNVIYYIGYYSYPSYSPMPSDELNTLVQFVNYLYIPFIVFAVIYFLFALMVKEAGVYAAYKNPDLGLSDIIYNAFATLKTAGWKLFLVNLLGLLELITYAAIIIVPIFIISIVAPSFAPDDAYYAAWHIWILIPIFSGVSIFIVPFLFTMFRLSIHEFFMDNGKADAVIIAYRKNENKVKEEEFIPLTEEKNENGETIYVELKKQKKTKGSDYDR